MQVLKNVLVTRKLNKSEIKKSIFQSSYYQIWYPQFLYHKQLLCNVSITLHFIDNNKYLLLFFQFIIDIDRTGHMHTIIMTASWWDVIMAKSIKWQKCDINAYKTDRVDFVTICFVGEVMITIFGILLRIQWYVGMWEFFDGIRVCLNIA